MLKEALKKFFQDKKILFFLAISVFLIAVRFLWLDKFPPGLNHDEADVVLSARNYWINGADISGVKFPASLFATKTEAGLSGLPSLILAPILGILNLNLVSTRAAFVLVNISTGIFLSLVVFRLSRNKYLSAVSFVVFLGNPWSFIYSRSTTEAPFALLFSLIGTYLLFSFSGKKIFYSLIFFALMFFSYFGAKPLAPLLLLLLLVIHRNFINKTRIKTYGIYFATFLFIVASYFLINFKIPDSTLRTRSPELIFSNLDKYSGLVDTERKLSIEFAGKGFFYNKFTSLILDVSNKYLGAFSPDNLFFGGDPRATYRLGGHGMFLLPDVLFIVLGIYAIGKLGIKKNRALVFTAFVFSVVGPIGSSLTQIESSYIFRAFLLLPGLVILISCGIYFLILNLRGFLKLCVLILVSLIYLFFSLNFFYFYFLRFPISQQENNFLSERVLVNYLMKSNEKTVVIVSSPLQIFQQYLYFSGYLNSQKSMPQFDKDKYKIGNVLLTNDCRNLDLSGTVIAQVQIKCKQLPEKGFLTIQDEKDAGILFKVYNDRLCKGVSLTPWRRFHFISDYSIEKLPINTFCERWINE